MQHSDQAKPAGVQPVIPIVPIVAVTGKNRVRTEIFTLGVTLVRDLNLSWFRLHIQSLNSIILAGQAIMCVRAISPIFLIAALRLPGA